MSAQMAGQTAVIRGVLAGDLRLRHDKGDGRKRGFRSVHHAAVPYAEMLKGKRK
jgi:hypothetical protein